MNPEVTVLIITFNHSKYIAECLDSILKQKTNFDFEVLIHNDASTDGTKEIIDDYIKKYGSKIHLINQTVNQYSIGINNIIYKFIVPYIKGRYVTYTDGDDYWCDENKLQKQFDYMETHKDCSLCVSNAFAVNKDGERIKDCYPKKHGVIDPKYIFDYPRGSFITSSTTFFRRNCFTDFPLWRLKYPVDDAPAFMQACLYGYVYKFKERMTCYRRFTEGSWSQSMLDIKKRVNLIDEILSALGFLVIDNAKIKTMLDEKIKRLNFELSFLKNDYPRIFDKTNRKYFKEKKLRTKISLYLRYKMPKLYSFLTKK